MHPTWICSQGDFDAPGKMYMNINTIIQVFKVMQSFSKKIMTIITKGCSRCAQIPERGAIAR